MKRSLTEIFVPKSCPLPADIAYIILEYANMCKFTDHSAVFYLYACPNPRNFVPHFTNFFK